MKEEIIAEIESLVYGGDGFGRLKDGRAVFVPFTLPGEVVKARVSESKRGHVKAELIEIISKSLERIQPKCRHFGTCGGCNYQHLPYPMQAVYKQLIFCEQLKRLAGIAQPVIEPIEVSPIQWNYRNHIQLHLNDQGKLGYKKALSLEHFEIMECFLPTDDLLEVWPSISIDPTSGINRVDLRSGFGGDVLLTLESQSDFDDEFVVDFPISVIHSNAEKRLLLAGNDHVLIKIFNKDFKVSSGSFFQVNTIMAEALVTYLRDKLPLTADSVILDAYCGVGLFSAFVAPMVKEVIGIEESIIACEDFTDNLDSFDNVALYTGDVENILPHLRKKFDGVILDPPRSGLSQAIIESLSGLKPAWIAYISCDPATLARDIRKLTGSGFKLSSAKAFDLFPQTYHIESVSILESAE